MALLESKKLEIGWEAPHFSLTDVNEQQVTLNSVSGKEGTLIIFTCNHCPYAIASWPLLIDLHKKFEHSIDFVAINPNDSDGYPQDSYEMMQKRSREWGLRFPYLRDGLQNVAKMYHAQCTPDIFLFDNAHGKTELYYHGRINDNWQNPKDVKENNLKDAMNDLLNKRAAPTNQYPCMGCSIKWK